MSTTINVKVYRYDPALDDAPYYKTYEVPWKQYLTALQALHYINDNIEPIGFDYSCCAGLCGRCGMTIDGKPGLACYTPLDEGDHTLEPLSGFPVVKDLFVDKAALTRSLDESCLEVQTFKSKKTQDMPAIEYDFYWGTLERLNMCRECGDCSSVCPILAQNSKDYAGPAAFGQMYLRANDGLDQRDRILDAVQGGIFSCLQCGLCTSVCPSHIDHVSINAWLRDQALEKGYVPEGATTDTQGTPEEEYPGYPSDPKGPAPTYAEATEGGWIDREDIEVEQDGDVLKAVGADGEIVPLTENIMVTGSEVTAESFA